jgi:predicted RNA-binding Zn ribbon-like protein
VDAPRSGGRATTVDPSNLTMAVAPSSRAARHCRLLSGLGEVARVGRPPNERYSAKAMMIKRTREPGKARLDPLSPQQPPRLTAERAEATRSSLADPTRLRRCQDSGVGWWAGQRDRR